ncbi:MAG: ABC transporter permease [Proteobacteria bacterium]|nr:ABC transporter permease [Pseudomonadota bacterium]
MEKKRGMVRIVFRRLVKRRTAAAGLIVFVFMILVALLADYIAPYGPNDMLDDMQYKAPSAAHPMGTDMLGRDVLSRVIHGSRVSLAVGLVSMIAASLLGIPLGIVSGYYGGWIDQIFMRVVDVLLAFPVFLLAIMIMVVLSPSAANVAVALSIVYVPRYMRLVRGVVLSIREHEYIEAARALGVRPWRIFLFHILPNCLAPVMVMVTISVGVAIIAEASLSFLGMGTQPPMPSWGSDLRESLNTMELNPWLALFPGLAILLTVLAINMLGDGLRDAIDPRLKQ